MPDVLMMEDSQLISRLRRIRRTIRLRLVLYGAFSVSAGGLAAFLFVVALDWALWLPALLRIVSGVLFVAGFAGAMRYWVVRPLRAKLGIDEIAGRLERHFGQLEDRLTSTVDFLQRQDAGSPAMMRRVVANTDQMLADLSLESALSFGPLVRRGVAFVLCAAVFAAVLVWSPDWARTGLFRHIHPFGAIEWPRNVRIVPLTFDQRVAVGESTTVRMKIGRGLTETLRGIVHVREPDGTVSELAMQRVGDTMHTTIDRVTTDLEYWFEAGDDNTRARVFTIKAVHRPEVVDVVATIEPPPYVTNRTQRVEVLGADPIDAPIGGTVHIDVQTSKPIAHKTDPPVVGLRLTGGELIVLGFTSDDRRQLSGRFEVVEDLEFRIELIDDAGFRNRGSETYAIRALPDAAPTVTVLEPISMTEVTTQGSLRLLVRVDDDFGITDLNLVVRRIRRSSEKSPKTTTPLAYVVVPTGRLDEFQAIAEFVWAFSGLDVSPGDVLAYTIEATDNLPAAAGGGQIGRSSELHVKIIGDVEFDQRIRDDLAALEARIRQAMLDQGGVLDETESLMRGAAGRDPTAAPAALDAKGRARAASLSTEEARLVRRIRRTARRFREVARRMERNQSGETDARRRIEEVASKLREVATSAMSSASGALGGAAESPDAETQQASLRTAADESRNAIDVMEQILRSVAQWGSFHGLLTRTRDLLDRQETLRRKTADFGKTTLGKSAEDLSPEEASALARIKRQQEQLAGDVEQLIQRLAQAAEETEDDDQAAIETIEEALRAARASDVIKRLRDAASAIGSNRTAAATLEQKDAEEGIRRIAAALRKRDRRDLAQLRKRIGEAREQVALLIEEQTSVMRATEEAGLLDADDAAFARLRDAQRTVKRNTRFLGEELGGRPRTGLVGRTLRQALRPQGDAETALDRKRANEATTAQEMALAVLEGALSELDRLARETADEAMRRTMADIRESLETIRDAQSSVNTGIAELAESVGDRKRLKRTESRVASRLAREQNGVLTSVEELRPELAKVIVYEWALERIAGWMGTVRGWLDARKIDDDLSMTADRIVRELDKLILALKQTEELRTESEFAEGEGGGAGEGRQLMKKPVPTVTELLVLKAMQTDINQRTKRIGADVDPDTAEERQLRELQMIGEDQAEVRRLAALVTRRARHP
ncbi:MAG: hypothetical protein IID36_03840 [Planctomycetes bacterium]|nr:hypothetical protein [Planctomycetota bacterium]